MTIGATATILMRPYIPQEESTLVGVLSVLWILAILSLILAGAGWKRGLNRIGLIAIFIAGWVFMSVGLHGYFGIYSGLTFVVAYILLRLGRNLAFSTWIERIVIIKRNPEYEEVSEEPRDRNEPLGELFG
jgi:low temperature requirement protein LtrA